MRFVTCSECSEYIDTSSAGRTGKNKTHLQENYDVDRVKFNMYRYIVKFHTRISYYYRCRARQ